MALKIEETCINCDVCEPVCPNQAISMGRDYYEIDAERCTECIGHFAVPQCQEVCPVECIVPDPVVRESRSQLLAKEALIKSELPQARDGLHANQSLK